MVVLAKVCKEFEAKCGSRPHLLDTGPYPKPIPPTNPEHSPKDGRRIRQQPLNDRLLVGDETIPPVHPRIRARPARAAAAVLAHPI